MGLYKGADKGIKNKANQGNLYDIEKENHRWCRIASRWKVVDNRHVRWKRVSVIQLSVIFNYSSGDLRLVTDTCFFGQFY